MQRLTGLPSSHSPVAVRVMKYRQVKFGGFQRLELVASIVMGDFHNWDSLFSDCWMDYYDHNCIFHIENIYDRTYHSWLVRVRVRTLLSLVGNSLTGRSTFCYATILIIFSSHPNRGLEPASRNE